MSTGEIITFSEKIGVILDQKKLYTKKRKYTLSALLISYNSLKKPLYYHLIRELSIYYYKIALNSDYFVKFLVRLNTTEKILIETVRMEYNTHLYLPTPQLYNEFKLNIWDVPILPSIKTKEIFRDLMQ